MKKIIRNKKMLMLVSLIFLVNIILSSTYKAEIEPGLTESLTFKVMTYDKTPISDATIGWNIQERNYWNNNIDRYYAMHNYKTNSEGIVVFEYQISSNENPYKFWVKKDGYKTFEGTVDFNNNQDDNIFSIQLASIRSDKESKYVDNNTIPGFEFLSLFIALFISITIFRKRKGN